MLAGHNVAMHAELQRLQTSIKEAIKARSGDVKAVQEKLVNPGKFDTLIRLWQDAVWLQAQNFDLPKVHLQDHSNEPHLAALYDEVCNTWNHCKICCKEREEAGARLAEQHCRFASASEWEQQTERHQQQGSKLSKLNDEWEKAVEISAASDSSWEMLVTHVNQDKQLYVHAPPGKAPRLTVPQIKPKELKVTLLKQLLTQACKGVQREDIVRDYVPHHRRWVVTLHLCLNTGNHAYEVMRNVLHFHLNADGTVRDLSAVDSDSWPLLNAGSIQSRDWLALGFDLAALLVEVFGPKMRVPLTKFHGEQIRLLFSKQNRLWQHPKLKDALERLKADKEAGEVVKSLLKVWEALSSIHSLVNIHPDDFAKAERRLDSAIKKYKEGLATLEFDRPGATPKPCQMQRNTYEHVIVDHLMAQTAQLHQKGLSLALMSSRYLEANNKTIMRRYKSMPGGGVKREDSFGNDPLFLTFSHLFEHNFVQRRVLYKTIARKLRGKSGSMAAS
jgi:hypothetical protein